MQLRATKCRRVQHRANQLLQTLLQLKGKSSIIAKLVDHYGPDRVATHFIPLNPDPDHHIGLLRHLMAHLILKYDLSDLYVASESSAALCEYFPKVLADLSEKGGQEVIFLDGLDQLKEDTHGER